MRHYDHISMELSLINEINSFIYSNKGQCLFVGSSDGISVVGWEPDREFDHIKSTWSSLCDMKILKDQLVSKAEKNMRSSV